MLLLGLHTLPTLAACFSTLVLLSYDKAPFAMATPEQFRQAMDLCAQAFDLERAPEAKKRLAHAALLFAQLAEYLERGGPLKQQLLRQCAEAVSLVANDEVRRRLEALLSQCST